MIIEGKQGLEACAAWQARTRCSKNRGICASVPADATKAWRWQEPWTLRVDEAHGRMPTCRRGAVPLKADHHHADVVRSLPLLPLLQRGVHHCLARSVDVRGLRTQPAAAPALHQPPGASTPLLPLAAASAVAGTQEHTAATC